jgi:cell division cycle 2-like protein
VVSVSVIPDLSAVIDCARAPEILFGAKEYSTAVDMWSVGCIFAELLMKEPLFQAKSELDLISMIFKLLGPPTEHTWPGYFSLPQADKINLPAPHLATFRQKLPHLSLAGLDLIMQLLCYDPDKRISAEEALKHPYFRYLCIPSHKHPFTVLAVSHRFRSTRICSDRFLRLLLGKGESLSC